MNGRMSPQPSLLTRQLRRSLPLVACAMIAIQAIVSFHADAICQKQPKQPELHQWARTLHLGLFVSIIALEAGGLVRGAATPSNSQTMRQETRSINAAVSLVHLISAISAWRTYSYGFGYHCLDALGVWVELSKWAEWLVMTPFLVYLAAAVDTSVALTHSDILNIVASVVSSLMYLLFGLSPVVLPGHVVFIVFAVLTIGLFYFSYGAIWRLMRKGLALPRQLIAPSEAPLSFHFTTVAKPERRKAFLSIFAANPMLPFFYIFTITGCFSPSMHSASIAVLMALSRITFVAVLAENHLHRLRTEQLCRELEEEALKNRTRRQFLRKVFHEVRVPLSTITMGLALLLDDSGAVPSLACVPALRAISPDDLSHDIAMTMSEAAASMSDTLNDILDMQKVEEGVMTLELNKFHLKVLADRVVQSMRSRVAARSVTITLNIAPDVPNVLFSDCFKIERVLANLVSNGVKFTRFGSRVTINISVSDDPVEAPAYLSEYSSAAEGAYTHRLFTFSVEDEGEGVAAANLDALFRSFSELRLPNFERGGAGIGLPLAKEYVMLLNGSLTATSRVGMGSVFAFSLPLRVLPEDPTPIQSCTESCSYGSEFAVASETASMYSGNRVVLQLPPPSAPRTPLKTVSGSEAQSAPSTTASSLLLSSLDSSQLNQGKSTQAQGNRADDGLRQRRPHSLLTDAVVDSPSKISVTSVASVASVCPVPRHHNPRTPGDESLLSAAFTPSRTGYHRRAASSSSFILPFELPPLTPPQDSGPTSSSVFSWRGITNADAAVAASAASAASASAAVTTTSATSATGTSTRSVMVRAKTLKPSSRTRVAYSPSKLLSLSPASRSRSRSPRLLTTGREYRSRASSVPSAPAKFSLDDMRVLLVDDTPTNVKMMQHMLTRRGIIASTASDGAEAIRLVVREREALEAMRQTHLTVTLPPTDENGIAQPLDTSSQISSSAAAASSETLVAADLCVDLRSQPSSVDLRSHVSTRSSQMSNPSFPDNSAPSADTVSRMSLLSAASSSEVSARQEARDAFQLILMDSNMPVMNGLVATAHLREELHFTGVIVGVTGNVMQDDVAQFLSMGADLVLPKPLYPKHVDALLAYLRIHGCTSVPTRKLRYRDNGTLLESYSLKPVRPATLPAQL